MTDLAAPLKAGPVDLTPEQISTLLAPINPNRVQTNRGQSYVEAWDVRRWLNRIFGFGGWSDETRELVCVSEREINPGRWTVVYRAQTRLTVKTVDGRVLSSWDDAAMGDSRNQPSLGDAHDMAMKTALSQALKRCAVNLGDAFGLSLYNDGSPKAVGLWSAAHPAPKNPEQAAVEDEPVKPEPEPVQLRTVQQSEPARDFVAEAQQCTDADCAVQVFRQAEAAGADTKVLEEIRAIGRRLREAAQAPRVVQSTVVHDVELPAADHAAAVAAFRAFTAEHGISDTDADKQAYAALGAPLDDVSPDAIWGLLSQLTAA
jgi:hypothetical protein